MIDSILEVFGRVVELILPYLLGGLALLTVCASLISAIRQRQVSKQDSKQDKRKGRIV